MVNRRFLAGEGFYRGLLMALARLEAQRELINQLNVFPVPDGDTGTNMTLTLQAAVREMAATPYQRSLGRMAKAAARGSLLGARGNSGVILSQFLRGWAAAVEGLAAASPQDVVIAFERAVKAAYSAVMEPVEGTMLTVGRQAARAAREVLNENIDLKGILAAAVEGARRALKDTPRQLERLRQAGVVDAGGQGLLAILEGCLEAFDAPPSSVPSAGSAVAVAAPALAGPGDRERQWADGNGAAHPTGAIRLSAIEYKYCTEFILKGRNLPQEQLRRSLQELGDSVLVVGDDQVLKIHLHTNHPGRALELAIAHGDLSAVQISNMEEQNREAARPAHSPSDSPWRPPTATSPVVHQAAAPGGQAGSRVLQPAVVAVAPGPGLADIFRSLGAAAVIAGGPTMNPSTREIVEAVEAVAGDPVLVLPNHKNILFAAEQAASLTSKTVRVIPSTSVAEGVAAIMAFQPSLAGESHTAAGHDGGDPDGAGPAQAVEAEAVEAMVEAMQQAMAQVRSGEVTRAVRDARVDGRMVQAGHFLGLHAGRIQCSGPHRDDVALELITLMLDECGQLVTLFYGEEVSSQEAEALARRITERRPGCEVEVYNGGQPHYAYLISVE